MFLKRMRVSFFTRIFTFSSLIVIFTLFISYIANIIFIDQFYIYRKKKMMTEIIETAKNYSVKGEESRLDEYIRQVRELEGIEVSIDRKSLRMPNSMMMNSHMSMAAKIPLNEFSKKKLSGVGALILYYGEKLPDGRNIYVSTSLSVMAAHKHETNLFNLITGFFALIFAMAAGAIFSKKITGDIALLRDKAEKISMLEFPEEIAIQRSDEIGDLSRSLEKMSHSLSSSINNLKTFISTASHELRTPIAIIINHATALVGGKIEDKNEIKRYNSIILKEILEMRELTENLLIISKLDASSYGIKKEKVDLVEIIRNSVEKYDFIEMEKNLQILLNLKESTIISDPKLLKLIFDNIIQNAFRYSPSEGTVEIFQEGEYLSVKNEILDSINIDIDIDHIQKPFFRGKNAEDMGVDGMGLGLSIIRKSADLIGIPFEISVGENFFKVRLKMLFCEKINSHRA